MKYRLTGSRGFTLVETIIVVVVLSIAAVAIISMQGNIFYGQSGNKDLQVGVQLMQECAEQILATRRHSGGYTAVNTNTCSALGNVGGFGTPSVTVTANNVSGTPSCPSNITCCPSNSSTCTVAVTVSKAGANLTPVTLELVNY